MAFSTDFAAKISCSFLLILYSFATISEVSPIFKYHFGFSMAMVGLGTCRQPPMEIIDMVSAPPATIISAIPAWIFAEAIAMDSIPEAQYLFMVEPGTSTVSMAISDSILPILKPVSASGKALPTTTSSIIDLSICGKSFNKCLITAAAISSGRVKRKLPRGAFPIAERYPPTIYAFILYVFLS